MTRKSPPLSTGGWSILKENFPDFQQGKLKFITYGKTIVNAMEEAGLEIAVKAPSPEIPSVAKAIEVYLQEK